jgi:hypothetical protein
MIFSIGITLFLIGFVLIRVILMKTAADIAYAIYLEHVGSRWVFLSRLLRLVGIVMMLISGINYLSKVMM